MSKNNNLDFEINPAIKAIDKENVMNTQNDMNDAIEGVLLNSILGLTFPLVVTYTERLAMAPGDTAFFLLLVASVTAVTAGSMADDLCRKARFVVEAHHVVCAVLTGTALFRCLTEALGTLTDYQSLPASVVVAGSMILQLAAARAVGASIKK